MTPARFLKTRTDAWNRLEVIISKTRKKGLKALNDEELHELIRLYPAVAIDTARARMYNIDLVTQKRINQLAISAHGLIYRRKNVKYFQALWTFFRYTYPRHFRKLWPYIAVAFLIFITGFLGSFVSTTLEPSNAYIFVPGKLDFTDDEGVTSRDISERFRQMDKPPMAAGIMTNNISVAFNAFALGITAGIGTSYLLFYNAMMIGGFAAHFSNNNLMFEFLSFITPHGILEIFAILVSAAAGLRLGLSLAIPGHLKRIDSLRKGAIDAVLLVLGTIPMFIVAGTIEGFVTPSFLPGAVKITLGVTVATLTIIYLLFSGKETSIKDEMKIG